MATVLVAPTSTSVRAASFRPEVDIDGTPTRVLVEQTGAVDLSRLGDLAGRPTVEEVWGVDLALEAVLDLQWRRLAASGRADPPGQVEGRAPNRGPVRRWVTSRSCPIRAPLAGTASRTVSRVRACDGGLHRSRASWLG